MTNEELKTCTKKFALRVIKLVPSLKTDEIDKILLKQLTRSSISVAANYRVAIKAISKKDFIYKLNFIGEEADESYFWLELLCEAEIVKAEKLFLLINEAKELTAIFTAQGRTAKNNLNKKI